MWGVLETGPALWTAEMRAGVGNPRRLRGCPSRNDYRACTPPSRRRSSLDGSLRVQRLAAVRGGKGERLDHDGHDVRRLQQLADVDVVELDELQAVDGHQVGADPELLLQDAADGAADI